MNPSRKRLILAVVWVSTLVAVLPIFLRWTAPAPTRLASGVALLLALLAAGLICWLFYRAELKRLTQSQALGLVVLVGLLTLFGEYVHHYFVDLGPLFTNFPTAVWQEQLQDQVVRLDPIALPHSYRFLPNAVVFWMQIAGVKFRVADEIYRNLTMLVLFFALYRWGRLFTTHLGSLLTVLLVGVVYPVSFVGYGGQLTDPLSHLSFLLALIFLETDEFFFFLSALLIGSLAKETVLGMLGFFVLFAPKKKSYLWQAPVLVIACLGAYLGVRTFVLHGMMHYQQVSGVDRHFVLANLGMRRWPPHFLLTGGAYLPFLVLAWKDTPLMLKRLTFYLLPLLLISSMLFSWLNEARNYMPLVFVLALVAGRYLVRQGDTPAEVPQLPTA